MDLIASAGELAVQVGEQRTERMRENNRYIVQPPTRILRLAGPE